MMRYVVSTMAVRPSWWGDTCPEQDDDRDATAACRIQGLPLGGADYRAGVLLDSADADFYWLQADAGDVMQITTLAQPSAPRDAVTLAVHGEDGEGNLCRDEPRWGPDGRPQPRSRAIAESSAVASTDGVNGSALTFTVPAQWIWYPGAAAPETGWYRIKVAPAIGLASYPQQYTLLVQRNPARESFPEVF
jgi:hypothetical protein